MRLFIALNFNAEFKLRLSKIMTELQKNAVRGNFSRTQNLHITLQFIGETENLAAAKEALAAVSFKKLPLTFNCVSRFRRSGGDICWLGVSDAAELTKLAQSVGDALKTRGFKMEDRSFQAHLTLGREVVFRQGFDLESFRLPEGMSYTADRISLMKSERIKGVLTYTELSGKTAGS